jgi:inhibitor of KinA sporulation pathway (predicted exonuclease)
VALARNLQTGSITPHFHVVFDDFYQTMYSDASEPQPNWEELIIFTSFRADIKKDSNIPELTEEWLSPEEFYQRQLKDQERKNHIPPPKREEQEEAPVVHHSTTLKRNHGSLLWKPLLLSGVIQRGSHHLASRGSPCLNRTPF